MTVPPPDPRPLAGIRVIDLCVVWTGPFGSMILGDLGAEVIKLENIHQMQPYTRGNFRALRREDVAGKGASVEGYPDRDPGEKPYERDPMYLPLFRNKRSLTIDLRSERGKANFRRLVAGSDVLMENNVPETLDKLGITYEALREINPGIIMVRCPAFGGDGAYKNYRAWGNQMEAMVGHSLLRGYADLPPTSNTAVFPCDFQTGAVSAFAVLAALNYRAETGKGQLVEIAQVENTAHMFPQSIMDYTMNGRVRGTTGNHDVHGAAPGGVYPCLGDDRWIAIAAYDDAEFAALANVIGAPGLAADPRFASVVARRSHLDELDAALAALTPAHDSHALAIELQAAGVAAGPVQDAAEILRCPQLRDRGFFERVEHRFTGTWDWPGMVFQMPASRPSIRRAPVGLGEDNEYVYKQLLGLSGPEYEELVATGDIGTEFDASIP